MKNKTNKIETTMVQEVAVAMSEARNNIMVLMQAMAQCSADGSTILSGATKESAMAVLKQNIEILAEQSSKLGG